MDGKKAHKALTCVENYRQLMNLGNRRCGLPLRSAHQLVKQYHMASLENIRTSNMIWTENMYTFRIMFFFSFFLLFGFLLLLLLFVCLFVLEAELCIVLALMELSL